MSICLQDVSTSTTCGYLKLRISKQKQKPKPGPSSLYQLSNFAKQTILKHSDLKIIYVSWLCGLTGPSRAVLAQGLSQVVAGAGVTRKLFQSPIWYLDWMAGSYEVWWSISLFSPHSPFTGASLGFMIWQSQNSGTSYLMIACCFSCSKSSVSLDGSHKASYDTALKVSRPCLCHILLIKS